MNFVLHGVAVSAGITIGHAHLVSSARLEAAHYEIPESAIIEAVQLLFRLANLKAEPTGALSVAALLAKPPELEGRRVCCVVSGGNVDPDVYRKLLASPAR